MESALSGASGHMYWALQRFETVLIRTKVLGSIPGTRIDLQEVFELPAAGKTEVVYERRKLEDVNSAIHEVETGHVKARLVFDLRYVRLDTAAVGPAVCWLRELAPAIWRAADASRPPGAGRRDCGQPGQSPGLVRSMRALPP